MLLDIFVETVFFLFLFFSWLMNRTFIYVVNDIANVFAVTLYIYIHTFIL